MSILEGTCLSDTFGSTVQEGCVMISVGTKKSGKTTFFLATLRAALEANAFHRYILVLPSFENEADGSYDWLREHKNVTVYSSFHPFILDKILKIADGGKYKTLFVIDDATSFASMLANPKNEDMIKFVSNSRHIHVTMWIIVHNMRNVLSPTMRDNVELFLIYDIANVKLLQAIWEEYLSCECTWNEFQDVFRELNRTKFTSMLLSTRKPRSIDFNSNEWGWIVKNRVKNDQLKKK